MKHNIAHRLISLNLALIMLLSILFTSAGAVNTNQPRTTDIALLNVADEYEIGPIQIGDIVIDSEDATTDTPITGIGWSYLPGELTLTEAYSGDPIIAGGDLILHTEGDVTVRGTDGPAISAKNVIRFCSSEEGSLHLYGGTNSPAISTSNNIQVESPLNLELAGDNCSALDSNFLGIGDLNYKNLAPNRFLCNQLYSGSCAEDAVLQPLFPPYVHDPNPPVAEASLFDLEVRTPDITDPTDNYLRFEAVAPDTFTFTIHMDPQGGSVAGLDPDEVYRLTIPYSSAQVTVNYSISTAELTLPQLPEPIREGYLFLGWNTAPAYNPTEYLTTNSILSLSNQTEDSLYAIWQEIPDSDYVILDGNGYTMSSASFSSPGDYPRYVLPLTDTQSKLPDLYRGTFAGWSTTPAQPFSFWTEGLLQPRSVADLTSGTTLYAVYSERGTPHKIDGNGYTTAAGNSFIQLSREKQIIHSSNPASPDRVVYEPYSSMALQQAGVFHAPGMALLDFSPGANSDTFHFNADYNYYARWAEAPEGSILLYSDGTATADERYGKVILPDDAAAFSLADDVGFRRAGYELAGWSADGTTILTQIPAPNEAGHIILCAIFNPCTVTYHNNGEVTSQIVSENGKTTIKSSSFSPAEQIFNGWNTYPDGSGEWYLPGDVIIPEHSFSLYAQYLDIPTSGNWVLFQNPDGPTLYIQQSFDSVGDNGNVTALFPACAPSWVNSAHTNDSSYYGYTGNQYHLVPNHSIFTSSISDYQFHSNGGLYPGGHTLKVLHLFTSDSSLVVFPEQSDFEYTPSGSTLLGWSGDKTVSADSTVYEPGTTLSFSHSYGNFDVPKVLYAVWDISDSDFVELAIPPSMASNKNSQIYLATYAEDGRMCSLTAVEPGTESVTLYQLAKTAETYQFLCLADDGTMQPIADPEWGNLP